MAVSILRLPSLPTHTHTQTPPQPPRPAFYFLAVSVLPILFFCIPCQFPQVFLSRFVPIAIILLVSGSCFSTYPPFFLFCLWFSVPVSALRFAFSTVPPRLFCFPCCFLSFLRLSILSAFILFRLLFLSLLLCRLIRFFFSIVPILYMYHPCHPFPEALLLSLPPSVSSSLLYSIVFRTPCVVCIATIIVCFSFTSSMSSVSLDPSPNWHCISTLSLLSCSFLNHPQSSPYPPIHRPSPGSMFLPPSLFLVWEGQVIFNVLYHLHLPANIMITCDMFAFSLRPRSVNISRFPK